MRHDAATISDLVERMARIGTCHSPSWSPDGERVAFISDLSGVPQVWTVAAGGGWPEQVTALPDPVSAVRWSPAGDWLACAAAPGGGMNVQVYLVRPDGAGLLRITDGGSETNSLGRWLSDGRALTLTSNRRNPAALEPWRYDLDGGSLLLLAEQPGRTEVADSRADGTLLLSRLRNRGDNDLALLHPDGSQTPLTPHQPPATFANSRFAPDGRAVYCATNDGRERLALVRIPLDQTGNPGPAVTVAERNEAEVEAFEIAPDGTSAVVLWNAAGRNEPVWLDLQTGEQTPLPPPPGELTWSVAWAHDGSTLAMSIVGSTLPSDIWTIAPGGTAYRQITHSPHPGVHLGDLVQPELVRFPAHDGLELSGWLYRPPGARGPAPFVLSFHGGPEAQERPRFDRTYQALLAAGIGVFAPNVRGSSGFGKTFVNLDNGPLRVDGIRDIAACWDEAVRRGAADPARIGIMGASYGGYMTMWGLARWPGRFAAGVNICGVVNFATFFAHTEPWMAAISKTEYGDPENEAAMLRELSPIHQVEQVRAPTLVIHGANDTNVPVVEAEQVVDLLRARGVPVEYLLFPDEGHGVVKAANRTTATLATVRWFARHLGM